ncbi:hypothetical protein QNI16_37155 [Cytophagaceae bacterium YF14B1]|uniref:Uncharacterized protein n=1 Tax=Xanthocytophaga flava TaxID=3048013 RepID=A0AAE3QW86_9BACT|nr:hypothetical protein [Xanthocytophaga flavus]MDJ1486171.1 hypothetical protein [Xanthocytophaga flavus]
MLKHVRERFLSKHILSATITIITLLLASDIFITYFNHQVMKENLLRQNQAENVKLAVSHAIYLIHNADLALRGYAAFGDTTYLPPLRFAIEDKDSIYHTIEQPLLDQHYPLTEFVLLKDSINSYLNECQNMKSLIEEKKYVELKKWSAQAKGYHLWLQYKRLKNHIDQFQDQVKSDARSEFDTAMQINYWIEAALLMLCVPILVLTAIFAHKQLITSQKLQQIEAQNSQLLCEQKTKLEEMVIQRTQQIQLQNHQLKEQHERIFRQKEQLAIQGEELALQFEALKQSKKEKLQAYARIIQEKTITIETIKQELEKVRKTQVWDMLTDTNFNNLLHARIHTEESWQQFKINFDAIYPNFFAKLRQQYPDVTSAEQRLAALIKLNLSSKECADTLGISIISVRKARYRLRKKLQVETSVSLEDFIQTSF